MIYPKFFTKIRNLIIRWPVLYRFARRANVVIKERFVDKYWEEVVDFVSASGFDIESGFIVAPKEFLSKFPNAVPYGYTFSIAPSEAPVVCLHKGLVDHLSISFVEKMLDSHCYAFGNSVFCVFTLSGDNRFHGEECYGYDFRGWVDERRKNIRRYHHKSCWSNNELKDKRLIHNILIITANNFGNVGDDAITHAAEKMISTVFPKANISIAAPEVDRALIESVDLVVLGGGGIYYDARIENAINYTNYMFFANEAGVPYLGIGIGTQGIKTKIGSTLFRAALNGSIVTVVRDSKDKDVLESIGVSTPVKVTQDIVFSLLGSKKVENRSFEDAVNKVGIALLDSRHLLASRHMRSYQSAISDCVKYLSEEGYRIVYICQSLDDLGLYRQLKAKFGGEIRKLGYDDARVGFNFYSDIDLCVTSRFHGLIFSVLSGTPVLSVGTNGSKTDRLISNAIPSLSGCHISLKDFSLESFKSIFSVWKKDPTDLVAHKDEVDICVSDAMSTVEYIDSFFLG